MRMQVSEIAPLVGSAYTWCNIVSRCTVPLPVIEGRGLPNLVLLPVSPLRDFDQAIAAEVASAAEVESVFDQLLARLAPDDLRFHTKVSSRPRVARTQPSCGPLGCPPSFLMRRSL